MLKNYRASGTYSGYDIFSDWIKALALSLSNSTDVIHDTIWRNRENQYMEIVKKHGQKTMEGFVELGQMLIEHWTKRFEMYWVLYSWLEIGEQSRQDNFSHHSTCLYSQQK